MGYNGTILRTTNGGEIPVELIYFVADYIKGESTIELTWSTATETNNLGFEILSFAQNDNDEWKKIGFIPGHGTTTETQHYAFTDKGVSPGKYQYRLKQIDYDGTFEYSQIVEVEIPLLMSFHSPKTTPTRLTRKTVCNTAIPES